MSRRHAQLHARRWSRVRKAVLDAANWRCAVCGKYANEVDHIIPLHRGGDPWGRSNLQAICKSHHLEKTRQENHRPDTPAEAEWRALVAELMAEDR